MDKQDSASKAPRKQKKKKVEVLKGNSPKNVVKRVIIANFKTGACYVDWKVNDFEKYLCSSPDSSKNSSFSSTDDQKTTTEDLQEIILEIIPKIHNGWEGKQDAEDSTIIKVIMQVGLELNAGRLKKAILEPIPQTAEDDDNDNNLKKYSSSAGNPNSLNYSNSPPRNMKNFENYPGSSSKKSSLVSLSSGPNRREKTNYFSPNISAPSRSNIFKRTGSVSNDDMDFLSSSLSSSLQSPCVTSGTFSFLSHKLRDAAGVMKKNKSSMVKNFFYSTRKHKVEKNKTLCLSSYLDASKRIFGGVYYENNDDYKEKANEFIEKLVKIFMEKRISASAASAASGTDMFSEISDLAKGGSGSAMEGDKQQKLLQTFTNFDVEIIKLIEEVDFNLKKKEPTL